MDYALFIDNTSDPMRQLNTLIHVGFRSPKPLANPTVDVKALADPITSGERAGIYYNTSSYTILV